ncbi:RDD family protein [Actinotalea sp. BY-33]|uniref:RDD family protein n=1 Tax=Actinotalea soli TaxID=2819234 RepID=A0A939RTX5_9CELL|nr:RDD family protein [Actinotalea soli]MBO1750625.1 RDD family protein [Actinotalea soli]
MTPRREDLGSWLEGTPGGQGPAGRSRLGLPEEGSGSMAPVSRRMVALAVDWMLSLLIANAFFAGHPMATLAIFAVSTFVLVATLGHTVGHRMLGLTVVRCVPQGVSVSTGSQAPRPGGAQPGTPGLLSAAVRTALLALVIPAVIWDGDGRGMHDVAAGTAILRR